MTAKPGDNLQVTTVRYLSLERDCLNQSATVLSRVYDISKLRVLFYPFACSIMSDQAS